MASAASLSEPHVLAHAKRRLFPKQEEDNTYAVVDTQFARNEWLAGEPIEQELQEQLAPFNHVQIGSGYPDLVGVKHLESELLAVDRFGNEPPLVVIEAKGRTEDGTVNVEGGVVQAYDRLHEANAAFVAAPHTAISQSAKTLAQELNIGVLGVDPAGSVEPVEVPRVVGNRTSDDATAIRFQATARGVANKSFSLNHPKNYLAYPLALYHSDTTSDILSEYVVDATDQARRGATFLGLIDDKPDGTTVTPLGEEVIRFALHRYETVENALAQFQQWQGSRKRFYELAPEWGLVTRQVVWSYPATKLLVKELQTIHVDGIPEPSLVDLVRWLQVQHPTFTVELFIRGADGVRSRVLTEEGELRNSELTDGSIYHSPTVFQLKAMMYHAGILTQRGAEPHRLDPETDVWKLCEPLRDTV